MRVLKIDLKSQRVVIRPETVTDLYVLSNVINIGDHIIAKTSRRVRRSGSEGRSGDESQRVTMVIGIEVEDFAFQDSSVSNRLRVKGKIIQGPEQYVSAGSYHTINLELSRVLTLIKPDWTKYHLQILKEAEEATKKPKICLIAVDKAEVCIGLLDNFSVNILTQEKSSISRKKTKEKIRSKQTQAFFEYIIRIVDQHILSETKNIVIGGPGFIKERLASVLREKFQKADLNIIVAGSVSGGNRVGISELLKMEVIDKLAENFQILEEQRLIEEFINRINRGASNIAYGFSTIQEISKTGAIETVILLDSLLRGIESISAEVIHELLREIDEKRGKIIIISS